MFFENINMNIEIKELEEIINNLPPQEIQVDMPLPDSKLLSDEFYNQILNNYIEYMQQTMYI